MVHVSFAVTVAVSDGSYSIWFVGWEERKAKGLEVLFESSWEKVIAIVAIFEKVFGTVNWTVGGVYSTLQKYARENLKSWLDHGRISCV